MTYRKWLLLAILIITISCSEESDDCPSKTCSDFTSQSQAQSEFEANRDCYENLDADNDGIACENLTN